MSKKGSSEERAVVGIFEEFGFAGIRVPSSGSRTSRDLPDVVAGNGRVYYAVEVKSSCKDYIYIREEQMDELFVFSARFGAIPLVVARFTRLPFVVFNPYKLSRTRGGLYRVTRGDCVDLEGSGGMVLGDFISRSG